MNDWPLQSDVDSYYGNPRGNGDEPNQQWVTKNIVRAFTPWEIVTAWDFLPVTKGIRVHFKCKDSLERVFQEIWNAAGQSQQKINEWGMNLYAGGFNFRIMKEGTRLSMHSWGCAIDFDSARNSFGDTTPNFATIPPILKAFDGEGWIWGGRWSKPDGMHWQAARIR